MITCIQASGSLYNYIQLTIPEDCILQTLTVAHPPILAVRKHSTVVLMNFNREWLIDVYPHYRIYATKLNPCYLLGKKKKERKKKSSTQGSTWCGHIEKPKDVKYCLLPQVHNASAYSRCQILG